VPPGLSIVLVGASPGSDAAHSRTDSSVFTCYRPIAVAGEPARNQTVVTSVTSGVLF